ncbi:MAG: drug/metabolite transporter (DMT)-like permease [Gammaproteobacteria bacterium]|jgi:drug/metabolite transporter (DMT)-like permease
MSSNRSNFLLAVGYILVAILLFDIQGAIIKHLGDRYPVQQLATFRNLFGLIPSLLVLYLSSEWHRKGRIFRINRWRLALSRGFFITGAQYCFYLSITKMELATASTLTYISPVIITLLSIPILGHKVGGWRWVAVATGFIGVVMIMAPGSELFSKYSLLPVGAALGYSLSTVVVRLFDDDIPTALLNLYASLGSLVGALLLVLFTGAFIPVASAYDWGWLIAMGLVGGCAVLALISAYRLAQPSSLSPFEYFGIPFAFIIGWVFFNEAPFDKLIPGVFLIVGGGLIIVWRERYHQQINEEAELK